jgi:hypothetical protein
MIDISFIYNKGATERSKQTQESFKAICKEHGLNNDSHMIDVHVVASKWAVQNNFDLNISGRSVTLTDLNIHQTNNP